MDYFGVDEIEAEKMKRIAQGKSDGDAAEGD